MTEPNESRDRNHNDVRRRRAEICTRLHAAVGWWSLLIFIFLGIALETMHGYKVGWYLDVGNDNRR